MSRIQVDRQGPVARLVLSHPPLNTLDVPLMKEIAATFRALSAEADAKRPRALLLASGVPGQFSQGVDPRAIVDADIAGRKAVFLALGDMVEAVWFSGIPLVCDVSGPALAGGAVLATLGDFVAIDAAKGKIAYSEVKVGLPVPYFIQRLVMSKVNPAALNDVLVLGRNVDAEEAVKIGFANAVYKTPAERDEVLQGMLGRITRLPPAAIAMTLRERRAPERAHLRAFRDDLAGFADFLTDDYLGKGLRAVLAGEAPKF